VKNLLNFIAGIKIFQPTAMEPVLVGPGTSPIMGASMHSGNLFPTNEQNAEKPEISIRGDDEIQSNDRVPEFSSILSANDQRAFYRTPKNLESFLLALEVGPKQAKILFSPSAMGRDLKHTISDLQNKLVIGGYEVDPHLIRCSEHVIKGLTDGFKRKLENQNSSNSISEHKILWDSWCDEAWKQGASDLHILMSDNLAQVMIRVDGDLEMLPDSHKGIYTVSQTAAAVGWAFGETTQSDSNSASMFGGKSNIYSMFKPRVIGNSKVGMRFQSIVGSSGPKIVTRLFDVQEETKSYDELGYSRSQIKLFDQASMRDNGIIIFSGATGSGKTKSQKTFIENHPVNGIGAIYSLEDPIELKLKGVHQIPLQRDLSDQVGSAKIFNAMVSDILRADPNGVLIGEMRDMASACAAIQFAETGHFVVGTLHVNQLSGIASRLTEEAMGVSREAITSSNMISVLACQSLLPKLCPHCKISGTDRGKFSLVAQRKVANPVAPEIELDLHHKFFKDKLGFRSDKFFYRKHGGCEHCNYRGVKKRTLAAEVYIPDEKWLDLTRKGDDVGAASYYRSLSNGDLESPDMTGKLIIEHAFYKSLLGEIDPRECLRFGDFVQLSIR
jgi:general secretion pathway protein E